MNIMKYLLRLMNERNMSAGCLADRLGINLRQIEEWKSGDTDIPFEYILPICRTLHITAYELLNSDYNCISNDDETELISCYRKCTPHDRTIIRNLAARLSNISNNSSTPPPRNNILSIVLNFLFKLYEISGCCAFNSMIR